MATVKLTNAMAEKAIAMIDWKRIDAMTDEDIAAQIAGNPDGAPLLTDEEIEPRCSLTGCAPFARRCISARALSPSASTFRRRACAIGSRGAACRTPRRRPISR
jgi:hypothetical protein